MAVSEGTIVLPGQLLEEDKEVLPGRLVLPEQLSEEDKEMLKELQNDYDVQNFGKQPIHNPLLTKAQKNQDLFVTYPIEYSKQLSERNKKTLSDIYHLQLLIENEKTKLTTEKDNLSKVSRLFYPKKYTDIQDNINAINRNIAKYENQIKEHDYNHAIRNRVLPGGKRTKKYKTKRKRNRTTKRYRKYFK